MRNPASISFTSKYRRKRFKDETFHCDICGWFPPRVLDSRNSGMGLDVHHIIPLSCGGEDLEENVMLLCPNHHTIVHLIWGREKKRYHGPTNREDLIAEVKTVEADPEEWARKQQAKVSQLLSDMINQPRSKETAKGERIGASHLEFEKKLINLAASLLAAHEVPAAIVQVDGVNYYLDVFFQVFPSSDSASHRALPKLDAPDELYQTIRLNRDNPRIEFHTEK